MNADTILLRQAHPNFVEGELPTSQVFMPNSEDQGRMSAYDGDQISAADAFAHYTQVLNKQSHSTWALKKSEADGAGTPASPDPLPEFLAHATIDFSQLPKNSWRKTAKRLKALAIMRGCQFTPSQT